MYVKQQDGGVAIKKMKWSDSVGPLEAGIKLFKQRFYGDIIGISTNMRPELQIFQHFNGKHDINIYKPFINHGMLRWKLRKQPIDLVPLQLFSRSLLRWVILIRMPRWGRALITNWGSAQLVIQEPPRKKNKVAIYVSYLGIYHDISPLLFPRQLIQLSLGIKSGKESNYFRCSFQMSHVLTLRSGKPKFPTGWKAKWSLSCSNWFAKLGHWCPGREHSRIRRSETDLLTSSMEDGWVVYWCTEASQGFPSSNHLLLNSFHQLAF